MQPITRLMKGRGAGWVVCNVKPGPTGTSSVRPVGGWTWRRRSPQPGTPRPGWPPSGRVAGATCSRRPPTGSPHPAGSVSRSSQVRLTLISTQILNLKSLSFSSRKNTFYAWNDKEMEVCERRLLVFCVWLSDTDLTQATPDRDSSVKFARSTFITTVRER